MTASHAKDGFPAQATLDGDPDTYWTTENGQEAATLAYDLGAETTFDVVLLQEHIAVGQRIERFVVEAHTSNGRSWRRRAVRWATSGCCAARILCLISKRGDYKISAYALATKIFSERKNNGSRNK